MRYYASIIALFVLLCAAEPMNAAAKNLTDVQAKLVIIHSFLGEYITWPGNYALDERSEVTVCSAGNDDVARALSLMEAASSDTLNVHVLRVSGTNQLKQCHILYLANDQLTQVRSLLHESSHYPLLTISSIPDFVTMGGMVGLENEVRFQGNFERNYVRYSLNLKAAQRAGIAIHPDALELARKVVRP